MKFAATTHIHRPLEVVFTYMSNIEHEVQWRNLVDVKVTSGLPLRQGSTYRYVANMMGRQLQTEGEITAFTLNQGWSFKSTSGPIPLEGGVAVESADGGTKVTLGGEMKLSGLLKLVEPILRGMMQRQLNGELLNLKHLLES
ncbi:MAG: SRPBCC family protein [Chloroflexi bacterium]|nr:SRPBCC family protein [Chloroflexota bacterium]